MFILHQFMCFDQTVSFFSRCFSPTRATHTTLAHTADHRTPCAWTFGLYTTYHATLLFRTHPFRFASPLPSSPSPLSFHFLFFSAFLTAFASTLCFSVRLTPPLPSQATSATLAVAERRSITLPAREPANCASRRPGRNGRLGSDPWDRAGGARQRAAACCCLCGQARVTGRVGGGKQACNAQTDHRRLPTLADGWLLPAAASGLHAAGAGRPVRLTAGAEPEPRWLWLCQLRSSGSPSGASS